ncbi:MAG: hypothetical protein HXS44_01405 [Theionarchaea archaeon]|nr:hypothetical protein [Theionarchaea archaeon]
MEVPKKDYTLLSFKEEIIRNYEKYLSATALEERKKKLKILCLLSEGRIWEEIFGQYGKSESYGDLIKYSFSYEDEENKRKRAIYYIYFDEKSSLLYIFTDVPMDIFNQTLGFYIQRYRGIYYLWIHPVHFNQIKNTILERYPNGKITKFIAKRIHYDSIECEIRPEIGRSMMYWGEDGRESLKEMQFYYGVLPTQIVFAVEIDIRTEMKFQITNESIFTLITSSGEALELFFEIIGEIIPQILEIKKLMSELKFEYKEMRTDEGIIQFPSFESAQILLTKEMTLEDVNNLINGLARQGISIVNELIDVGSINFSATVVDDYKKAIFGISANEDQITLIPKYQTTFDSFMKFFRFITENLDQHAQIRRFGGLNECG